MAKSGAKSGKRERRAPVTLDADRGAALFPDDDAAIEKAINDERDLIAAVAQLGSSAEGGKVRVYRQGDGGHRDLVFMDEYLPSDFSIKQVQIDFGPGVYRAQVQNADGGMVTNKAFRVGKSRDGAPPASERAAAAAAAPVDAMTPIMSAMLAGFKEMGNSIRSALPQQMSLRETLELMNTIQNGGGGKRGPDSLEMFERFTALQGLMRGGDSVPRGADGDISDGAIIMRALEVFGKPLVDLLSQAKAMQAAALAAPAAQLAAPAAPAVPAAPVAPVAAPAAPASEIQEDEQVRLIISMAKPIIVAAAASDADPYTYANMLLDMLDEKTVHRYLRADDWEAQLVVLVPELAAYMPWCRKLRAVVVELLTPPAPPAADPAVAGGLTAVPEKVITGAGNSEQAPAGAITRDT